MNINLVFFLRKCLPLSVFSLLGKPKTPKILDKAGIMLGDFFVLTGTAQAFLLKTSMHVRI